MFFHLVSFFLSRPGISSCTLSTWLTCRLASSEQQRMFLEREHSLHHSHEMTEKVGEQQQQQQSRNPQLQHVEYCMRAQCLSTYQCVFVCPPNRKSWTTLVTAFLRSPTTGTLQHHHDDDVSPQASSRTETVAMNRLLTNAAYTFFYISCDTHTP